ncbi:phytanoyl-CoA dioxygenase family protein [Muricoccus radiodurans]|uniref:phytanoyl-CoA dioxygenase family protein n=1 Tax=Muricoccus radiodurans TaxID=2231721 RepID=UPI003CF2196F
MLASLLRSIRRTAMVPWHLMAIATSSRSFAHNPFLGSDRLNRWGLHARRVAMAQRLAASRRARLARDLSPEDAAAFDRDGIVVKPDFLPPDRFARLKAEIEALRAPAREVQQGGALSRLIPLSPAVLAQLPETRALVNEPGWRGLLNYVASTRHGPVLFIQTIISHVGGRVDDPQTELHSDTFYPSMKCWLYLHDVAEEDGPFVYAPGSHRATPRRLWWERARSLSWRGGDEHSGRGSLRVSAEMLRRLGYGAARAYPVRANTLVIADTYGFHARGPSARPSVRIALWAQGRRNPFLPWAGLSPTSLDYVRDRQAVAFWAIRDTLARLGLGRPYMHDAGAVRPGDPAMDRSGDARVDA